MWLRWDVSQGLWIQKMERVSRRTFWGRIRMTWRGCHRSRCEGSLCHYMGTERKLR